MRIRAHSSLHGRVKLILCFAKVGQKRVHDPTAFGIKLGTVVDLPQLSIHIMPVVRPLEIFRHDLVVGLVLLVVGLLGHVVLLLIIFAEVLLLLIFAGGCRR